MADSLFTHTVKTLIEKLRETSNRRHELVSDLASLDDEIHKLRQGIFGLLALIESESEYDHIRRDYPQLFEQVVDPRLGLTEAIRQMMKTDVKFYSPTEVRDAVVRRTTALDSHKNPLASVHTTLKRLVDADEVITAIDNDGKTTYGYIGDEKSRKKLAAFLPKEDADDLLKEDREKAKRAKTNSTKSSLKN